MSEALGRCDLLVAVEVDAADSAGVFPLPAPLDRQRAEEIGVRLAADLGGMAAGVQRHGFAFAGALYDQTQLLQPGFPVFASLEQFHQRSLRGGGFHPRILTLGASDGSMPDPALEPRAMGLVGPLLVMPVSLCGPADSAKALALELETVLLESGQLSPAAVLALQQAFDLRIAHARFMTINDLSAMLRLQLEHVGLPQLWDLLDAALFAPDHPAWVTTDSGNTAAWRDGGVDLLFQTFDDWARDRVGSALEGDDLIEGYQQFLRVQRQFGLSLGAHGLETRLFVVRKMPADGSDWQARRPDRSPLEDAIHREITLEGENDGPARVTEHTSGDLGTLAYTLERVGPDGQVRYRCNYYPLRPEAIADIQERLRGRLGSAVECAWPGRLCFDADQRRLVGDPDLDNAPPQWH